MTEPCLRKRAVCALPSQCVRSFSETSKPTFPPAVYQEKRSAGATDIDIMMTTQNRSTRSIDGDSCTKKASGPNTRIEIAPDVINRGRFSALGKGSLKCFGIQNRQAKPKPFMARCKFPGYRSKSWVRSFLSMEDAAAEYDRASMILRGRCTSFQNSRTSLVLRFKYDNLCASGGSNLKAAAENSIAYLVLARAGRNCPRLVPGDLLRRSCICSL